MSRELKIVALILGSIALYYYGITVIYNGGSDILGNHHEGIIATRSLSKDYDATLEQAKSISGRATDLKNRYGRVSSDDKEKMNIILPDTIDSVALIDEVNTIFNKSGFKISDINYNRGVYGGLPGYSMLISTRGTYESFKNLVHNLETSMRFYTIKSISFSVPDKKDEKNDPNILDFSLKIETYSFK